MLEAVSHNATFAISTNTSTAAGRSVSATSTEDPWKKINDNLRSPSQKIDVLQKDVKRLQYQGRSRCSSLCHVQTGHSNQQASGPQEKLCFYHDRFGENALKFPLLVVKLKELSPDTLVGGSTNITSEPTVQSAVPQEQRLHVTDRTSHIRFLVDSGSVVSVIPRTLR